MELHDWAVRPLPRSESEHHDQHSPAPTTSTSSRRQQQQQQQHDDTASITSNAFHLTGLHSDGVSPFTAVFEVSPSLDPSPRSSRSTKRTSSRGSTRSGRSSASGGDDAGDQHFSDAHMSFLGAGRVLLKDEGDEGTEVLLLRKNAAASFGSAVSPHLREILLALLCDGSLEPAVAALFRMAAATTVPTGEELVSASTQAKVSDGKNTVASTPPSSKRGARSASVSSSYGDQSAAVEAPQLSTEPASASRSRKRKASERDPDIHDEEAGSPVTKQARKDASTPPQTDNSEEGAVLTQPATTAVLDTPSRGVLKRLQRTPTPPGGGRNQTPSKVRWAKQFREEREFMVQSAEMAAMHGCTCEPKGRRSYCCGPTSGEQCACRSSGCSKACHCRADRSICRNETVAVDEEAWDGEEE